jgi:NTP pyrophosphatase (non-canonical NTP hydrolase)
MIYYIYHIPGKKIGVTTNLKSRVEDQQGYELGEYEILGRYTDIKRAARRELYYQRIHGYPVDIVPYDKLNCNKNKLNMKINVTEATTTFPCPINKLKGQLMDNIGMRWETEHGELTITTETISWIMKNIKKSMFDGNRSYVYNKAFARFYDNHNAYTRDEVVTVTGGLQNDNKVCSEPEFARRNCEHCDCKTYERSFNGSINDFDLIRMWANQRGIYEHGDTKTQSLKLVEEVGEICRAILKQDHDEVIDGIGDAVVVLTNLAELQGVKIEDCIKAAYKVIAQRSGKMVNGTFKKD